MTGPGGMTGPGAPRDAADDGVAEVLAGAALSRLVAAARGPATGDELHRERAVVAAMASIVGPPAPIRSRRGRRLLGRLAAAKVVVVAGVAAYGVAAATGIVPARVPVISGDEPAPAPAPTTAVEPSVVEAPAWSDPGPDPHPEADPDPDPVGHGIEVDESLVTPPPSVPDSVVPSGPTTTQPTPGPITDDGGPSEPSDPPAVEQPGSLCPDRHDDRPGGPPPGLVQAREHRCNAPGA